MSKLSDRIIQVLIRKDVSIHAQLFRFMSLLGTIAMAVGGVYTLAEVPLEMMLKLYVDMILQMNIAKL